MKIESKPVLVHYSEANTLLSALFEKTQCLEARYEQDNQDIDLKIELREMVPYHVMQTDKEIRLNFNKTSVKPNVKKITQIRLANKALVKPTEAPPEALVRPAEIPYAVKAANRPRYKATKYTGARIFHIRV